MSTAAGLLLLPVLVAVGSAAPAQANPAEGYISGAPGLLTNDWANEGEITRWSHAYSNAAGMWQAILWADGAIEQNGTTFDESDIDCEFGPNTEYATRNWQSRHQVGVDGRVGPQTFGRADNKLTYGPHIDADTYYVYYLGSHHVLRFIRLGELQTTADYAYIGSFDGMSHFVYHYKAYDCGGDPSI